MKEIEYGVDQTKSKKSEFTMLLEEMDKLHERKSHDYASQDNPYGNYLFAGSVAKLFSHSERDMGFVGRLAEKLYRLANLERSNFAPMNETIGDTELDICVIVTLWMAARRSARIQEVENQFVPDNSSASCRPTIDKSKFTY